MNQNIIETVRCLPRKYGGLNMFDLNVKMLGAKLHYLRIHWGTKSQEGNHLQVQIRGLQDGYWARRKCIHPRL